MPTLAPPTSRPAADPVTGAPPLHLWGSFRSPDVEAEYRWDHLAADTKLAIVILAIAQVALVPVLNDYRLFGLTPQFWSLAAARGGFSLASLLAWQWLRRGSSPATLDRILLGLCLGLSALNLYVASTRPPNFNGAALGTLTLVIGFYAIAPLPTLLQALPALLVSGAVLFFKVPTGSPLESLSTTTFVLTLLVVNGLGATISIHLHRTKRLQFAALQRETALRRGLETALGDIRTLESILPICSHCRRVRSDADQWDTLERYIVKKTETNFSHGICPDCLQEHYPEEAP